MTEQGPTGPRTPADLAGQLREAADRIMAGWTSMTAAGSGGATTPSFHKLPRMPATMSAEQIESFLQDLAARRAQVQALVTQLERFDEQLGSLEAGVRPFVEWTRTWADLEKTMTEFWRPPSGSSG